MQSSVLSKVVRKKCQSYLEAHESLQCSWLSNVLSIAVIVVVVKKSVAIISRNNIALTCLL
jgi:hypothetical protein